MGRLLGAAALGLVLALLLPSGLASPQVNLEIVVEVTLVGGSAPPAGVQVDLTASGSSQTCTATTTTSGGPLVVFVSGPGCWLEPGWYTASVAPQVDSVPSTPVAVLPPSSAPDTFYASATDLTTGTPVDLTGLSDLTLNQTLRGTVTSLGGVPDVSSGSVLLIDPTLPLVLDAGTLSSSQYDLTQVPAGNWTAEAWGFPPGSSVPYTNFTSVNIEDNRSGLHSLNLTLGDPTLSGNVEPNDRTIFTNETNLTLWDTGTGRFYSIERNSGSITAPTNNFVVGDFSSLLGQGDASQQFLLLVAPQGYSTSWTYLDVNARSAGSPPTLNFPVEDLSVDPATWQTTTLQFGGNFSAVNVSSSVQLTNDSTYPNLPNASVGDLYTQVAMDFGGVGQVNATPPDWNSFLAWLRAVGPVYPAEEMGLRVGSLAFPESGTSTIGFGPNPSDLDFNSLDSFGYDTGGAYLFPKGAGPATGLGSYEITIGYAFPQAGETTEYTVELPRDYALEAGSSAPPGVSILPGPGGNYTTFTIVPKSSPTDAPNGSMNLTVVRSVGPTAVVSVASPNFAFSNATNVLSKTHDNYAVLVGLYQNVSFSSASSTFPPGTNATSYAWNFGDGSRSILYRQNTTAWHEYRSPGKYVGSLTLTSNTGNTSVQDFTVYVDGTPPTPVITTSSAQQEHQAFGNTSWVWLNWSQSLQLNATGSNSTFAPGGGGPVGRLAYAEWNMDLSPSFGGNPVLFSQNFSAGSGTAGVFSNLSYKFQGAGNDSTRTVNLYGPGGVLVYSAHVHGWVYKVVLKLYDAAGNEAWATLWVFVNDTALPVVIGAAQGGPDFQPAVDVGQNVTHEISPGNSTCNVELSQWSYAPGNGTLSSVSWNVSAPDTVFGPRYYNETGPYRPWDIWLAIEPDVWETPYQLTLTVTDEFGNRASSVSTFVCDRNAVRLPVLVVRDESVLGGSTSLLDGDRYTVEATVSNQGGNASVANDTVAAFYLQAPGGGDRLNLSDSDAWFLIENGEPRSTANATSTVNIPWNNSYLAQATFTAPSGVVGTLELCANATSPDVLPGGFDAVEGVICTGVTFSQGGATSPLGNLDTLTLVAIAATVAVVVLLFVFLLVIRPRRRKRMPAPPPQAPTGLPRDLGEVPVRGFGPPAGGLDGSSPAERPFTGGPPS